MKTLSNLHPFSFYGF